MYNKIEDSDTDGNKPFGVVHHIWTNCIAPHSRGGADIERFGLFVGRKGEIMNAWTLLAIAVRNNVLTWENALNALILAVSFVGTISLIAVIVWSWIYYIRLPKEKKASELWETVLFSLISSLPMAICLPIFIGMAHKMF